MRIPDIEIRTGVVREVQDNGAGIAFKLGNPPLLLSIGAVPRLGRRSTVTVVPNAVSAGEYIAVAVRPSLLPQFNYALLAYKRPGGAVHPANFTLAKWILVGSGCVMLASIFAGSPTKSVALFAVAGLVAISCAFRLLAVRKGVQLLRRWQVKK